MPKEIDKSKITRILIRGTNWVGDVVMAMPALEAVRANFPEGHLSVLARPWVMPLFENHPAVDEVLPLHTGKGGLSDLKAVVEAVRLVRSRRYDLAVLFQNAFQAALISYLSGIEIRVGYNTDGRGFLLSHAVPRDPEVMKQHQVEYYLHILRGLGWDATSRDPSLFVDKKDSERIESLLLDEGVKPGDPVLVLSPGAVFGPAKRWPAERFSTVGDRAWEQWGAAVVILGSGGEKSICLHVQKGMKGPSMNLCGTTTLGEAIALIGRCNFFVTNDSGLMHVAAALGVPLVAVFGSTDPTATGPRSDKARVVRHEIDCSPCLKPQCSRNYQCLVDISVEEVWETLVQLKEDLG
jgi:heptosyltransferase-2